MSEAQDAARAAAGLTAALEGMSGRLDAVKETSEARAAALTVYGLTNRRLIYLTIISVILDVALTVVLGVVAVQAHDATTAARKASASNYALCEASNTARHQQVALWDFVIGLPSSHAQTAQERHNVTAFRVYLGRIFGPRDCAALGRRGHQ